LHFVNYHTKPEYQIYFYYRTENTILNEKCERYEDEISQLKRGFSKVCNQTKVTQTLKSLYEELSIYKTACSNLNTQLKENEDKVIMYQREIGVLKVAAEMTAAKLQIPGCDSWLEKFKILSLLFICFFLPFG